MPPEPDPADPDAAMHQTSAGVPIPHRSVPRVAPAVRADGPAPNGIRVRSALPTRSRCRCHAPPLPRVRLAGSGQRLGSRRAAISSVARTTGNLVRADFPTIPISVSFAPSSDGATPGPARVGLAIGRLLLHAGQRRCQTRFNAAGLWIALVAASCKLSRSPGRSWTAYRAGSGLLVLFAVSKYVVTKVRGRAATTLHYERPKHLPKGRH